MSNMESGSGTPGGADSAGQSGGKPGGSLHEVEGVQGYIAQIGDVASALSRDDALTRRVMDAVHTGSSAAVERIFQEVGLDSTVSILMVDADDDGGGEVGTTASAAATNKPKTRTITVTIGFGPISISVTVKKESK